MPKRPRGEKRPADVIGAAVMVARIDTERHNLTMRMSMRRFTRLTNAFSKKFDNHCHALALYFVWYNWMRIHKTLRVTPAMAAGLSDQLLDMSHVVEMLDAAEDEKDAKVLSWQK